VRILKKIFVHSWKHYAAACGIGLLLTFLMLLKNGFGLRIFYMDGLTVAGAVLILLGLLMLTTRLGAFDIFSFSFSTLRSERRYHTLYDYTEAKSQKRRKSEWTFMPYLLIGAVFLGIGLLLGIGL